MLDGVPTIVQCLQKKVLCGFLHSIVRSRAMDDLHKPCTRGDLSFNWRSQATAFSCQCNVDSTTGARCNAEPPQKENHTIQPSHSTDLQQSSALLWPPHPLSWAQQNRKQPNLWLLRLECRRALYSGYVCGRMPHICGLVLLPIHHRAWGYYPPRKYLHESHKCTIASFLGRTEKSVARPNIATSHLESPRGMAPLLRFSGFGGESQRRMYSHTTHILD